MCSSISGTYDLEVCVEVVLIAGQNLFACLLRIPRASLVSNLPKLKGHETTSELYCA